MADDFDDDIGDREPWVGNVSAQDRYVEGASTAILKFIQENPEGVFYERQLQVQYEGPYYHWVTTRALNELVGRKLIKSDELPLGGSKMRFFFSKEARYWKRKAGKVRALVRQYSQADFIRALGRQAEMLFDAAMPREGFIPVDQNVREYEGRKWEETGENLDRIFVRDGIGYGAEIKNTLRYIEGDEFLSKLRMCEHLGLRPLFIARMMPKNYIWQVFERGGYCIIFKHQLYPFGYEKLARTVRDSLGLSVDCPAAIEGGTIRKFLKWHLVQPRPVN